MTNKTLDCDKEIEKAIEFLVIAMKKSCNNPKPVILHSIRVGLFLKELGYSQNLVVAGILHDVVEDSDTSFDDVKKDFGTEVASLVECATHNMNIADKTERYKYEYNRCLKYGKDALIVVAADFIDNTNYYDENTNIYNWLLGKISYFINFSKEALSNEPVYDNLVRAYSRLPK